MTSEQLKLLAETVQQLSLARDIETVMHIVRTAARNLTGADGATFILKDNDLCYYADEDTISPLWKGQRFPMSACVSGWVMLNKQAAIIPDIYNDARIPVEAYRPTFVKSLAMVPIRTIEPIGAIGNYWANQHIPSAEELQLLQSLADITSVSIENVYVYNELEDRVRKRTKELESANAELETFSYSVSHDLRAPLRQIITRMEMMKEDFKGNQFDEVKAVQGVEKIIARANGMNKLIDSLLNFSKSGRQAMEIIPLNIKQMVEQVFAELQEHGKDRNILFEIEEIPNATGDAVLIKQVWTNLLSNAIKYTALNPAAKIKVGYEAGENGNAYYVEDNGIGFDMAYYNKMFGMFQRLHDTSTFDGNGIGLALTQRILHRHGGEIWATGELDKGAKFSFTLPQ
ncbi:MAG TPA: ATP-binding protein [Chitinophagales bacterium]|nr:ATP-binding protein [Chitinophagales bacterium]